MGYDHAKLIKTFEDVQILNRNMVKETPTSVLVFFLVNGGLNLVRKNLNESLNLLTKLYKGIKDDSFEDFGHYRTAVQLFTNSTVVLQSDLDNLSIIQSFLPRKAISNKLLAVSKEVFEYTSLVYETRWVWEDALPVYIDFYHWLIEQRNLIDADFLL